MNYGRFFEFDFESSNLEKGVAVFNYRWLEQKRLDDGKKTPHHPVYLVFTQESIKFNLHYLEYKNKGNTENKNPVWRHYHNTIIEFRLSSNLDVSDGLTDVLNDTYLASFPVSVNTQLRKDIKVSFDSQDCREEGFNGFACFEPEGKDDYGDIVKGNTHFLRRIILDFLYDLEFTDVFKNIPFYDRVSAKLGQSFLFKALTNKTRYYYYRTVLSEREVITPCTDDKDVNNESTEKTEKRMRIFAELYTKYEQDWVNSILDKRAMKLFHESPWFEESNVELEQVYWSRRKSKWDTAKGNGLSAIKNIEEVDDVSELNKKARSARNRIKYLHKIGADKDSFALTVEDVIELIMMSPRNPESKTFEHAKTSHGTITETAAKWEIVHYHFLGLLKMWSGNITNLWWSLVLSLSLLLLVVLGLWGITKEEDKTEDVAFLCFVVMWYITIWGYRHVMRSFFRHTWGSGFWELQMPHLLAAVITAWFTMSMTDVLFKYFAIVRSPVNWSAMVILFLSTLLFVGYESRQLNPYDKRIYNLFSSLFLIGIAYFYSVVVGVMVFKFFGEPMIKDIIIDKVCNCVGASCTCAHEVAPPYRCHFIFLFSSFATFIGIFLQLMFRGRPVTDSNT